MGTLFPFSTNRPSQTNLYLLLESYRFLLSLKVLILIKNSCDLLFFPEMSHSTLFSLCENIFVALHFNIPWGSPSFEYWYFRRGVKLDLIFSSCGDFIPSNLSDEQLSFPLHVSWVNVIFPRLICGPLLLLSLTLSLHMHSLNQATSSGS